MFRFQNGSIKSKPHLEETPEGYGFDSKMVRLKEGVVDGKIKEGWSFDSKMVRLKG